MEKVLYTIDELTGLITAVALLRPSRSVFDVTVGTAATQTFSSVSALDLTLTDHPLIIEVVP